MECPKCKLPTLQPVNFKSIEVDRCEPCGGIWLDALEDESIFAIKGAAAALDVGGTSANATTPPAPFQKFSCPHCKVPMIEMVVNGQPHIKIESCTTCHGKFFDAGELADASELTFIETIQSLFIKNPHG